MSLEDFAKKFKIQKDNMSEEEKMPREPSREMKMTFMQFYTLSEMTTPIDPYDFRLNDDKHNIEEYHHFNTSNLQSLDNLNADTEVLYQKPEDDEASFIVALNHKKKSVAFYCGYDTYKNNGLNVVQVFAIWRDPGANETLGLPKSVFFDLLIPNHDVVISDDNETMKMIARWKSWTKEALRQHMFLYFYDGKKFQIETDPEALMSKAWGKDKGGVYGGISKHSDLDGKSFNL